MESAVLRKHLEFLTVFMKTHITYHGVKNFPVENFLQIFTSSAALSEVFILVSEVIKVFITNHSSQLIQINSLFGNAMLTLCVHKNKESVLTLF